ncbi:MAG: PilW family protein [Pseudomonadaceae bacterium]|nr:PilW family protein [Pseudomonadaceae bacterium]
MMPTKHSQAGFSILELLISLLLGLVVIAGIVQLFVGNSRTYEIVTAQSRLQENARYSFDFITQAARDAGFFGCAPEDEFVINGLVGTWDQIPEYDLSRPIDGFNSNEDGTYAPTDLLRLPRTEGATNLNVHIAGNGIDGVNLALVPDIVIFRSVEQPVARLNVVLQSDAEPEVFTPGGEPEFEVDDVVVVSDCEQAAMFKVTGVATAGNVTTLSRADGGGIFDNTTAVTTVGGDILPAANPPPLSVLGRAYGGASTIGRVQTTIFYIAESAIETESGTINALWRKVGREAPVELVQGVENMQVFYGVDTTNDDVVNVNRYQEIDAVADLNSVVAIRVRLDISSPDEVQLQDGTRDRLRRTFSKTISVRNAGV